MSVDVIYNGRRARMVDELVRDSTWVGLVAEYRDGERVGIEFGDPGLDVEPTDLDEDEDWDEKWEEAHD
jgi:hypothetical protein